MEILSFGSSSGKETAKGMENNRGEGTKIVIATLGNKIRSNPDSAYYWMVSMFEEAGETTCHMMLMGALVAPGMEKYFEEDEIPRMGLTCKVSAKGELLIPSVEDDPTPEQTRYNRTLKVMFMSMPAKEGETNLAMEKRTENIKKLSEGLGIKELYDKMKTYGYGPSSGSGKTHFTRVMITNIAYDPTTEQEVVLPDGTKSKKFKQVVHLSEDGKDIHVRTRRPGEDPLSFMEAVARSRVASRNFWVTVCEQNAFHYASEQGMWHVKHNELFQDATNKEKTVTEIIYGRRWVVGADGVGQEEVYPALKVECVYSATEVYSKPTCAAIDNDVMQQFYNTKSDDGLEKWEQLIKDPAAKDKDYTSLQMGTLVVNSDGRIINKMPSALDQENMLVCKSVPGPTIPAYRHKVREEGQKRIGDSIDSFFRDSVMPQFVGGQDGAALLSEWKKFHDSDGVNAPGLRGGVAMLRDGKKQTCATAEEFKSSFCPPQAKALKCHVLGCKKMCDGNTSKLCFPYCNSCVTNEAIETPVPDADAMLKDPIRTDNRLLNLLPADTVATRVTILAPEVGAQLCRNKNKFETDGDVKLSDITYITRQTRLMAMLNGLSTASHGKTAKAKEVHTPVAHALGINYYGWNTLQHLNTRKDDKEAEEAERVKAVAEAAAAKTKKAKGKQKAAEAAAAAAEEEKQKAAAAAAAEKKKADAAAARAANEENARKKAEQAAAEAQRQLRATRVAEEQAKEAKKQSQNATRKRKSARELERLQETASNFEKLFAAKKTRAQARAEAEMEDGEVEDMETETPEEEMVTILEDPSKTKIADATYTEVRGYLQTMIMEHDKWFETKNGEGFQARSRYGGLTQLDVALYKPEQIQVPEDIDDVVLQRDELMRMTGALFNKLVKWGNYKFVSNADFKRLAHNESASAATPTSRPSWPPPGPQDWAPSSSPLFGETAPPINDGEEVIYDAEQVVEDVDE